MTTWHYNMTWNDDCKNDMKIWHDNIDKVKFPVWVLQKPSRNSISHHSFRGHEHLFNLDELLWQNSLFFEDILKSELGNCSVGLQNSNPTFSAKNLQFSTAIWLGNLEQNFHARCVLILKSEMQGELTRLLK